MSELELYRGALTLIASDFRISVPGETVGASDYNNWRQEFAIEALRGIDPRTGKAPEKTQDNKP